MIIDEATLEWLREECPKSVYAACRVADDGTLRAIAHGNVKMSLEKTLSSFSGKVEIVQIREQPDASRRMKNSPWPPVMRSKRVNVAGSPAPPASVKRAQREPHPRIRSIAEMRAEADAEEHVRRASRRRSE